jgi:hypothetical protein
MFYLGYPEYEEWVDIWLQLRKTHMHLYGSSRFRVYLPVGIVTCISGSRLGFWLEIGFIDHYNTRLVTTLPCSAVPHLHTLPVTSACSVFDSNCVVTATKMAVTLLPLSGSLNGCSILASVFLITPYTDRGENTVFRSCSSIVAFYESVATAVSLAPQFFLWANMPHYVYCSSWRTDYRSSS